MQMRSIQANLFSQQQSQNAAMTREVMGNQAAAARQQFGQQQNFQNQMALQRQAQDARERIAAEENDIRHQEFAEQMKFRRQQEAADMNSIGMNDAAKFLIGQAEDAMDQVRESLQSGFTWSEEDGGRKWESLQRDLATINQDPTLSGMARAQAIYQKVFQEMPIPSMKPVDINQEVKDNTAWVEDPNNPGRQLLVGRAREYSSLYAPKDQEKPAEAKPVTMQEIYADQSEFQKWLKMGFDALTTRGVDGEKSPSLEAVHEWIKRNVALANGEAVESGKSPAATHRWTPEGIVPK